MTVGGAKGLAKKLFVLLLFVAIQSATALAQSINAEETKARVIIMAYDDFCVQNKGVLTEKVRASLKARNAVDQDIAYQEARALLKEKGIDVQGQAVGVQENAKSRTWAVEISDIPLIVKYENDEKCHVFIPYTHQTSLTKAFETYVSSVGKHLKSNPRRVSKSQSLTDEEQIMFRIAVPNTKQDMLFAATFRKQKTKESAEYGLAFTMIPDSLK